MGNQIQCIFHRGTKVKEIHIQRPSNSSDSRKERSPTPTDMIPHQRYEDISMELDPGQFESPIEVQCQENENSQLFNAQQNLINRLETELASVHSDLNELKVCYEQKLKKSRSNTASFKAETALIIYELRENVKQLETENTELTHKLQRFENSDIEKYNNKLTDAHTELILNLSEQLLSANEKIRDLNSTQIP